VPGEATLTAAKRVKVTGWFFILVLFIIFIMTFCSLVIAFSGNNVLTTVNKDLSLGAAALRLIEAFLFIISMGLLFAEISAFTQVFLVGHIVYALQLIILGYLVFNSGYLSRVLGLSLISGGLMGYLLESLTHFYFPRFVWVSALGVLVAILAEIALGLILVMQVTIFWDPKMTVTMILEDLGEATTAEIIAKASHVSRECKDRIPGTLIALEKDNKVMKRVSKEKKAIVWTLVS